MRKSVMITLIGLLGLLTLLLLWFVVQEILEERALEQPADARMLFIGNSFTENNELDRIVAQLASELGPEWDDIFATRVAPGGYKLVDHLGDVENSEANPLLRQLLVTGSAAARDWDLIVIQEQSQIPGFSRQAAENVESFAAAPQLHRYASDTGATIMLLETWGHAEGDPRNTSIFPDFLTMQNRLAQGTRELAAQMSASGNQVFVIPAGRGFQLVYQDVLNNDENPLAEGSFFRRLYAEDGRHPSLSGSYLAACIVVAAYTGQPVTEIDWRPRELDTTMAAYLRRVADRVVFGAEFAPQDYPWSS